ncbi:MAG: branched-chain amino acid transaminase [Candidatus Portiera sp.]|nr:branched-chain amino acid transaminase [Portiera sp.]
MEDKKGVIWFDGEMVDWKDARVHVLTHTLHYGLGVFEGVRCYPTDEGSNKGSAIFRLDDHTKRLFNSAHILRMKIPFSPEVISQAQLDTVRINGLNSGYIRPMCFYGSEEMGLRAKNLKTHVIVASWEWAKYMSAEDQEMGIKVRTSSYTRHHVNITMCKAKTNGNYVNSILALEEAFACGCNEALLLDNEGYVAEGSGENIFMVKDGELHTPALTSCLDGITRRTIMTLAQEFGIKYTERQITRDEIYVADEAFFSGTAAEIVPISILDGRTIGSGNRGPITEKLQKKYFEVAMGKDPKFDHWLSYANK